MKTFITFSFLFAMSTVFAISPYQKDIADETDSLFQRYLATCQQLNIEYQPVYLHNASREKDSFFTDITILNFDLSGIIEINDIMERIIYGDADVVHLSNITTQKAAHLYEMLEHTYAHFIHVPNKKTGIFVASKYPLSQATITLIAGEDDSQRAVLEFAIYGANTHKVQIDSLDLSLQMMNSNVMDDDHETTSFFLGGLPVALTILKQQYSPFRPAVKTDLLTLDTFKILPVKSAGNDDRGGGYVEIEGNIKWGGSSGVSWGVGGSAGAYDDHGNYVEVEVKQNDKGEGSVDARAGHEKE